MVEQRPFKPWVKGSSPLAPIVRGDMEELEPVPCQGCGFELAHHCSYKVWTCLCKGCQQARYGENDTLGVPRKVSDRQRFMARNITQDDLIAHVLHPDMVDDLDQVLRRANGTAYDL